MERLSFALFRFGSSSTTWNLPNHITFTFTNLLATQGTNNSILIYSFRHFIHIFIYIPYHPILYSSYQSFMHFPLVELLQS